MSKDGVLLPASTIPPTNHQRLFVRYFTGILIDLVVLNLFVEYSGHVNIDSFTVSLLAVLLLQVLLKMTIALEHRLAKYFNAKEARWARIMRFVSAWAVLFGSKFVILETVDVAFGNRVVFSGSFNGLVWLMLVLVVMIIAEEAVVRLYGRLA